MHKFIFSPELFFSAIVDPDRGNGRSVEINRGYCRDAMLGMVERYQLASKSVLCPGAGEAFEEFWLFQNDCELTLNDIDLPIDADDCPGTGLVFYHGDAGEALEDIQDGQFDLLYVSSFHPDEIRREAIQTDYATRRSPEHAYHHVTWPDDKLPYHTTIYDALAKVKDGGLAILQHYRGGVCIDSNPHYVEAIERQFKSAGLQLLEVYTFRRSTAHLLVVGYKGDASHALEFSKSLQARPEIKTFHGRYGDKEISTDVVKAFELANEQIRPREVFAIAPTIQAEPELPEPEQAPAPEAPPAGILGRLRSLFRR